MLGLIDTDLDAFEKNPGGSEYLMCKHAEGIGLVVPFDWAEQWCPSLSGPFEHFMERQTVCMKGVYVCDVTRFLNSKLKESDV